MKKKLTIVASALLLILIIGSIWLAPYALTVRRYEADPHNGYYADYFVYVSPKAKRAAQDGKVATILAQPNNSGTNSDDPTVHENDAWWTGFERKAIADELGVILLVPAFLRPGEDSHIYTHALDRDTLTTERADLRRIDLQLIAMIDHTRSILAEEGINVDEKILIQGFSASGMFANRFTILHPERVKAATIGSPGGFPVLPVAEVNGIALNYPAGIADLEALTGQSFNAETYKAVPQLIYMGDLDDNDSLDFTDGWDPDHAKAVDALFGADPLSRWADAETIYLEAGANANFLLIQGVGHDRVALQDHSTDFFRQILNEQ